MGADLFFERRMGDDRKPWQQVKDLEAELERAQKEARDLAELLEQRNEEIKGLQAVIRSISRKDER